MKIKHLFFLTLFLPLTGCNIYGDPPSPTVYTVFGNATDRTITVETFNNDYSTNIMSFSISPGEKYSFDDEPFVGQSEHVIVSNGILEFTQSLKEELLPNYLFNLNSYKMSRVEKNKFDRKIFYEYVFTDYDFSEASGNNITEVSD